MLAMSAMTIYDPDPNWKEQDRKHQRRERP